MSVTTIYEFDYLSRIYACIAIRVSVLQTHNSLCMELEGLISRISQFSVIIPYCAKYEKTLNHFMLITCMQTISSRYFI